MKILLTGGSGGQVGSEFIKLVASHNTSHNASNNASHNTSNKNNSSSQHIELIPLTEQQLDITQPVSINEKVSTYKPDIVVNGAAYTAVDKAEDSQDIAYAVNRDGSTNLANACRQANIPLLHISTDYVFDGEQDTPYIETDLPTPNSVYGKSKWEGEESLRSIHPEHIILRTSWVFSSFGNNFVKTMLRLADKQELNVVADQWGAPTSAKSIAQALLTLCLRYSNEQTLAWGTYHFSGSPHCTWHQFAQKVFETAQTENLIEQNVSVNAITTEQYPTKAKRPKNSTLDCNKILSTLGIQTPNWKADLHEMIRQLKTTQ